jgi:hypothetical protein
MRFRKELLFFFCLVVSVNSLAQMAAFQDEAGIITPTFRYDVIRQKKIASIAIHVIEKPDGKPMHDDGLMQFYRFDSTGRLAESFYTIKESEDSWDTVRTHYYYDKKDRLLTKRTKNAGVYDTWYYVWYDDGNLKKEAHVQETPGPGDMHDFRIGSQKIISADSFAYNEYPKQLQRFGYNEQNTLYEKVITQYDDKKRITGRYSHYQVGWLFSQVDLKYDSVYRIKEYTYSSNLSGEMHRTTKLDYDRYGNILTEKVYSADKQQHEIEYLYDNNTGLISDKIDRDYSNSAIEILKFSYTFLDVDDVPPVR